MKLRDLGRAARLLTILGTGAGLLAGCGTSSDRPVGIGRGVDDLKRSPCASAAGGPCTVVPQDYGPGWHDDLMKRLGAVG